MRLASESKWLWILLAVGCGADDGKRADADCRVYTCPVGTSPQGMEAVTSVETLELNLVDVTGGPSDASARGSIGYAVRTEASCSYACVAIEPCPDTTVPIITEDCYTCAQVTETGEIVGGACGFEGVFVESEGEASPIGEEEEEEPDLPDDEEVPGGEEGSAPACRTSWVWLFEGDLDGNGSVESSYDDHANTPQEVGDLNQSILLEGWLDREVSSVPGCQDVDVYVGELTCAGTARISIDAGPGQASLTIGDQVFTDSVSSVALEPGRFEARFACADDWGGYEVEVDFGG